MNQPRGPGSALHHSQQSHASGVASQAASVEGELNSALSKPAEGTLGRPSLMNALEAGTTDAAHTEQDSVSELNPPEAVPATKAG